MDTDVGDTPRPESSGFAEAIGLHHAMAAFGDEAADDLDLNYGPPAHLAPMNGSSIVAPPAEAGQGDDESRDAVRARLEARGLLVRGTAIIVPSEPRPETPVLVDDVLAEADGDHHPNAVAEDDWDVADTGGAVESVRCPQCRGTQPTSVGATRFRCRSCERAWRWAVCESCDEVGFAVERQESWRCTCGHFTRSWWRTDVAPREALLVVGRRRDLLARAERASVRAGMRKRRWKIIAGGLAGLVAVLGFVVVVRAGETTPAAGTAETCRQFARLRSDLASGTLDAAEVSESLARLGDAATGAVTPVHDAATELVAVASPSKAAFLVAQTKLADACTAVDAKR